ncbi:MAG: helix-turn-helix transcriptional regulator [Ectothiorhodospiraceae bacterium]|nr:helix-turn-helix transcriptional regulator [Ectothiorhodospiraceae bacterium]
MDFYTLSDKGIEKECGHRIKSLRLRKNITQKEVAGLTRLSLNAIKSLESGRGKLSTLIVVLRELGALDHLDSFIPEISVSPMQLAKMQGKVRERASGERLKEKPENEREW